MATLGVQPQDFSAAIWTRRNKGELEKLVEFDSEELEARVDELESAVVSVAREAGQKREMLRSKVGDVDRSVSDLEASVDGVEIRVDGVEDSVESLESQVTRLDGMLDGVSTGLQENRKWISDVEDRVDDAVGRVDATRREASDFKSDVEDEFESVQKEIRSVENWMGDELGMTQELIQEEVGSVEERVDALDSSFDEFSSVQRRQNQRMIRELTRIRRLQERSMWDKARSTVGKGVEACKSAVGRISLIL
jgi:chromosome segregation ATPase